MAAMQISASSALTRPQMMPIQRGASRLSAPMRPHSRQAPRQVSRQGLFGLGVPELALVAGAAALLFGPAKIPQLGQALGKTAKSVKAAAEVRGGSFLLLNLQGACLLPNCRLHLPQTTCQVLDTG
mmetsp:Transcript_18325/g.55164  ORF Transcript_18325/g.55164 Transcript_18325/m.55164 type:complete len:126 (-) Transcript_18325:825-1202(-)